jgi:hypothetical protein
LKKVIVSEHVKQTDGKFMLTEKGEALFHAFGVDFEELENGIGSYSTAIIEWPDGSLGNVPVEHIRFLEPNV